MKILVVDDDIEIAELLEIYLKNEAMSQLWLTMVKKHFLS